MNIAVTLHKIVIEEVTIQVDAPSFQDAELQARLQAYDEKNWRVRHQEVNLGKIDYADNVKPAVRDQIREAIIN